MKLSRRQTLQGAAALASLHGAPAWAKPLRGGELLPGPDFSQLREAAPYLIGVRPHRRGGVQLTLDAPYQTPSGKKYLIHNYGHGGAGITLSWGCAAMVVDLVNTVKPELKAPTVAVLGTGVIGLTVATELRRRWPELPITVYAKSLDVKTTVSWVAGGQFEPSGIFHEYQAEEPKKLLASMLRKSRDRVVQLQSSGERLAFGVAERKNYTLDHENKGFDLYTPRDVIPRYRVGELPFEKLNVIGREYSTWLMNPTMLLPKLAADLAAASVVFKELTLASKDEVLALPQNVIINCTGLGAKTLFDDQALVPQRGHLIVLKKTSPLQHYFFSGGCANPVISYLFCRQDELILGGTVHSGDDSLTQSAADETVFNRLLANGQRLFGGEAAACTP